MSNVTTCSVEVVTYQDKNGSFRFTVNGKRVSREVFNLVDRLSENPCLFFTSSYINRKGETCYKHSHFTFIPVTLADRIGG